MTKKYLYYPTLEASNLEWTDDKPQPTPEYILGYVDFDNYWWHFNYTTKASVYTDQNLTKKALCTADQICTLEGIYSLDDTSFTSNKLILSGDISETDIYLGSDSLFAGNFLWIEKKRTAAMPLLKDLLVIRYTLEDKPQPSYITAYFNTNQDLTDFHKGGTLFDSNGNKLPCDPDWNLQTSYTILAYYDSSGWHDGTLPDWGNFYGHTWSRNFNDGEYFLVLFDNSSSITVSALKLQCNY